MPNRLSEADYRNRGRFPVQTHPLSRACENRHGILDAYGRSGEGGEDVGAVIGGEAVRLHDGAIPRPLKLAPAVCPLLVNTKENWVIA
ncbi:MAG: hypothetical protein ACREWG_07695 [Gammaproteobacteria bacterium]